MFSAVEPMALAQLHNSNAITTSSEAASWNAFSSFSTNDATTSNLSDSQNHYSNANRQASNSTNNFNDSNVHDMRLATYQQAISSSGAFSSFQNVQSNSGDISSSSNASNPLFPQCSSAAAAAAAVAAVVSRGNAAVSSAGVSSTTNSLASNHPANVVFQNSFPEPANTNSSSTNVKKYNCRMCSQSFDTRSAQQVHYQIHMREAKPYKCNHCAKSFANSSYLTQHMRIHLGHKPYVCETCSKRFTQLSHVQQHRRTHSGDKPYKCPYASCPKAFSQLSNLQSHSRCHQSSKQFKCNSCYKCFDDERSLFEHIPKHKDSKHLKKHICQYCGKSYAQETYLMKHLAKHVDRMGSEERKRLRRMSPLTNAISVGADNSTADSGADSSAHTSPNSISSCGDTAIVVANNNDQANNNSSSNATARANAAGSVFNWRLKSENASDYSASMSQNDSGVSAQESPKSLENGVGGSGNVSSRSSNNDLSGVLLAKEETQPLQTCGLMTSPMLRGFPMPAFAGVHPDRFWMPPTPHVSFGEMQVQNTVFANSQNAAFSARTAYSPSNGAMSDTDMSQLVSTADGLMKSLGHNIMPFR